MRLNGESFCAWPPRPGVPLWSEGQNERFPPPLCDWVSARARSNYGPLPLEKRLRLSWLRPDLADRHGTSRSGTGSDAGPNSDGGRSPEHANTHPKLLEAADSPKPCGYTRRAGGWSAIGTGVTWFYKGAPVWPESGNRAKNQSRL